MTELDLLDTAAAGMRARRTMLDVAARNVAAAQASTLAHPYARLVARFADPAPSADDRDVPAAVAALEDGPDGDAERGDAGPRFLGTVRAPGEADPLTEMIAVLDAQRGYERDAAVFDVGKRIAERTLDLERGA